MPERLRLCPCGPPSREVAAFVAGLGLPARWAYRLRLAADEITTNVVQHGYRGEPGWIELTAYVDGDLAWLCVVDEASPFDPTSARCTPRTDLDSGPPGGLGLLLVRAAVRLMCYERVDGRNRTTLLIPRGGHDGAPDRIRGQ